MAGITFMNHQVANPVAGDMRQNVTHNCMEIYNGTCWTPIEPGIVKPETLSESIGHAMGEIGYYIDEDYRDNPTIQDAYAAWCEATERFQVIANMAEK
jgi:hypothetical protein